MKHVLIIGSLNMDLSIQTDRMPRPGETLAGYGFAARPGGKGANQAAAAALLGAPVRILGAVGRDVFGGQLREALEGCRVDCGALAEADRPTGLAMITVCRGENCILIEAGANGAVTPGLIDQNAALLDWADLVVLQLEIPLETVVHAARRAREAGAFVILNPAPAREDLPPALLSLADLLIPNEHEASLLLGGHPVTAGTALQAARALREAAGCRVLITLGSQGCVYWDGAQALGQPAASVEALDTTAAGDSFIGGLCRALAEDRPMAQALRYASAAAAVTVTRRGALPALPSEEEVRALYSRTPPGEALL